MRILRDDGSEASRGELGRIVCKLPMAPGTMTTMFGADERFRKNYFEAFEVCGKRLALFEPSPQRRMAMGCVNSPPRDHAT